jgi:hypothetical protein
MKTLLILRRHQYLAMASTFLIVLALIAGTSGCDGGGGNETYELIISSTPGGSVTDPGEGVYTYDEGTVVPLIAGADGDYQFVSWTGDVGTVADINAATTNITMNGDYSITANFESIPLSVPCAPSEWAQADTPTIDGFALAPESLIIDYALAADGEVAYAAVEAYDDICEDSSWVDHEHRLLKSDDHGATWTDLSEALEDLIDVDGGDYIDYILRVATDWVDPDFVAVALYWWDESAGTYYMHVFFSTDGGDTFEDAGEVEDSGVYFTYMSDVITDLVVTPDSGGDRDIFIGGTANSVYGAGLFRCTVTGGSPGAWEDATDYNVYEGWDDLIYSELVTDIIVSPSWIEDKTVLVTTVATDYISGYYGVYLQSGSFSTTPGWNTYSTLGIDPVEIKTDNAHDILLPTALAAFDARAIAGLTLPEDYNSKNPADRVLWAYVNYWDYDTYDPMCDIMRVEDDSADPVGPLGQIEEGGLWLTNISYHGTIAEGEAIAGVLGDGGYPYSGSIEELFTTCCEGVQVYRNDGIRNMDICCVRWQDACKPPTGRFAMSVAYVGDDKAYAVTLMSAFNDEGGWVGFDEGAWSATFDDGDTWNQLSLIDTYIDYLSDVEVSPDCNKTCLVSVYEDNWDYYRYGLPPPWVCYVIEYDYGGGYYDIRYPGCDSVWLHTENLLEAEEYSGQWLRTWCGILEEDWGMLRLPPSDVEITGDTVVLVDYDTSNVYINYVETLACWDPIGATELDQIVELSLLDTDTLFALDRYSDVDYGYTIAVWGDHILVGGEDGDVSYSNDGGETFELLENTPSIDGYVTVAFDSYFDQNNVIYAAVEGHDPTSGGIYLWVLGESEDWTDIDANHSYAYTGLVLDTGYGNPMTNPETGAVLYASYDYWDESSQYGETGVARCLTPILEICCDVGEAEWDYLNESDPEEYFHGYYEDFVRFRAWPDALKICGCLGPNSNSKLFAIDSPWYDMCEGEDGTVWTVEDSYAKRTLQLTGPADGATITANPSTCFNVPFALYWDRLCDAYAYDIQFALDEDFTLILETVNDYTPLALDAPNYLVAEGELSCEVTYYWRVRVAQDGTGQLIHSWWSEPWSFTITSE